MRGLLELFCCVIVGSAALLDAGSSAAGDKKVGEDAKAFEGVWEATAVDKQILRLLFRDGKFALHLGDPAKPEMPHSFWSQRDYRLKQIEGKHALEYGDPKDDTRIEYRLEKGKLTVIYHKKEYVLEKINVRVTTDAAAKPLRGAWKVQAGESNGKPATAEQLGIGSLEFDEDRCMLKDPAGMELANFMFRIDASKSPATLDVYGLAAWPVILCVYEVKGDEMRFVLGAKDARPASFDTAKTKWAMLKAKREKKE